MDHPLSERTNRTCIATVVFVDIVAYSMLPVSQQVMVKERFNQLTSLALQPVGETERIILDTGDGAAISFLGDPEDALFVATSIRDAVVADPGLPLLQLRIGLNIGPIKIVKDLNGRPNIIGDGINTAQRVMSFADTNQIVVSRSYYEVVSCLTQEYARLFHYLGIRKDKHVREHEIYGVSVHTPAANPPPIEHTNNDEVQLHGPEISLISAAMQFDTNTLARLEKAMQAHIGPIATVLIAKLARTSDSLAALVSTLETHLSNDSDRQAFRNDIAAIAASHPHAQDVTTTIQTQGETRPSPIDPASLAALEGSLRGFLGPIAGALIRRLAPGAADHNALCLLVAQSIPDEHERRQFIALNTTQQ